MLAYAVVLIWKYFGVRVAWKKLDLKNYFY